VTNNIDNVLLTMQSCYVRPTGCLRTDHAIDTVLWPSARRSH